MRSIRWGILSTARIGTAKVIPALQRAANCRVIAIASRSLESAQSAQADLGIPLSYGSYDALLADPEIDAIYNPLPNHLHLPWTLKALQAGKHVLCEKPIGLNAAEAQALLDASRQQPQLKVMEAFMYRFHPQWRAAQRLVNDGALGELRSIHTLFSYYNDDPQNVRNVGEYGGGGLLDIGCYAVSLARFLFAAEPLRVNGIQELDPRYHVDRLFSGILDFGGRTATFTVGTQLANYQRVQAIGDDGRLEIEIPFNAPPDRPTRLWLQQDDRQQEMVFPVCDQYILQGEAFAHAILENQPVPTPLDDALANMKVLDALSASAQSAGWVQV